MNHTMIVITGGPSGGKTTLIEAIKKELGQEVLTVPEAASLLYRGGFMRSPSDKAQAHVQRAIYYVQRELEGLAQDQKSNAAIVCDRGSLDGLAYWPTNFEHSFLDSLGTNLTKEIDRYQWVLHLDTATPAHYDSSNPIRTESYDVAWQLNEKIKNAWSSHPRRLVVAPNSDFFSKMALCLRLIRGIMAGQTYESLLQDLR